MPKFRITTLGCKVNQSESDSIAGSLEGNGWVLAEDNEPADVCIINTCAVTQKASQQSRQAIRQLIRSQPHARILVTGCYSQVEPEVIQNISGVHSIVTQSEKETIPKRMDFPDSNTFAPNQNARSALGISKRRRTRAFLKIQDGCDAFCTYCIVPYARGRSRSLPTKDVLDDIRKLTAVGYREVVLAGIHLGCYGKDLMPTRIRLADLLEQILSESTIERIRLSSIEPLELDSDLIQLMTKSERICRHFHIPLQSGDNEILHRMGRPYTRDAFRELVMEITETVPHAALGLDVLIGFPGETDIAFHNTLRLVEELPVSYLHVFPFSPRKGTPAYSYKNKVPAHIIKSRCKKIRILGRQKREDFYRRFVGKTLKVLIEERLKDGSRLLKGMTSNYIPVLIEGEDHLKNQILEVNLAKFDKGPSVFGNLKHSA
jgi:threonylcarbamoyladenosine tRNA methylthiotransferase MtaB